MPRTELLTGKFALMLQCMITSTLARSVATLTSWSSSTGKLGLNKHVCTAVLQSCVLSTAGQPSHHGDQGHVPAHDYTGPVLGGEPARTVICFSMFCYCDVLVLANLPGLSRVVIVALQHTQGVVVEAISIANL